MTIMFMGDSVDNQLFHAVEHALGQTATHRRDEAYRKVGIWHDQLPSWFTTLCTTLLGGAWAPHSLHRRIPQPLRRYCIVVR